MITPSLRPAAAEFRFAVDGGLPELLPSLDPPARPAMVTITWKTTTGSLPRWSAPRSSRWWNVEIAAAVTLPGEERPAVSWHSDTYRDLDGTTGEMPTWVRDLVESTRAAADLVLGPPPPAVPARTVHIGGDATAPVITGDGNRVQW